MGTALFFLVVTALVLGGTGLGLIAYRRRHPTVDIQPGLVWRLAVGLIFLGSLLAFAELGGFGLAFVVLAMAGACLVVSRSIRRSRDGWHWPTVIVAFLVVPAVALFIWATLLRR